MSANLAAPLLSLGLTERELAPSDGCASSAAQARMMQERANERILAMQAEMAEMMRGQTEYLLCKHALGFCVRHNRSPKPLRRLKHSMTLQWLKSIPVIDWHNVGGQARESDERCPAPTGSRSKKGQI